MEEHYTPFLFLTRSLILIGVILLMEIQAAVDQSSAQSPVPAAAKQTKVEVSSLAALRDALTQSDQQIVMKPGRYMLTELPADSRSLGCSGSNNRIDLSGVYVEAPVGSTRRGYLSISGDDNEFRGGTFEDTYQNGLKEISDFSAYNQNRSELARGLRGGPVLRVSGNNNTVAATKITVRGSFPYGYGSIYGIGRNNVYGLDKRCGILIKGENNTIDNCEVQQRAFGHGIYMQSPADKTTIRNTIVEGIMRPSKDLYLETDPKDLPARSNHRSWHEQQHIDHRASKGRDSQRKTLMCEIRKRWHQAVDSFSRGLTIPITDRPITH